MSGVAQKKKAKKINDVIEKKKIEKSGRGEVSIKIEQRIDDIRKYYKFGLTDKQVCDIIGIGESSLNRYKEQNPILWESIKKEKLGADVEVVATLYKKAIGFEYDEVEQIGTPTKDKDGNEKIVVKEIRKKKKYFPPDTLSIIYWLRNRQGWMDKQKEEKNDDINKEFPEFEQFTDEQLNSYIEKNK